MVLGRGASPARPSASRWNARPTNCRTSCGSVSWRRPGQTSDRRPASRHLLGLGGETVFRHDPVQDVVVLGFLRGEALAEQRDLQAFRSPTTRGRKLGRPAVGAEADMAIGQGEEQNRRRRWPDRSSGSATGRNPLPRPAPRPAPACSCGGSGRSPGAPSPRAYLEAREMGLLIFGQRLVGAADIAARHEVRAGAAGSRRSAPPGPSRTSRCAFDQQVAHLHRQRIQRGRGS